MRNLYYYAEVIKELRQDNKLKQEDVAKAIGVNQQVYSRYELGKNEMPIRHLISICKFYNVTSDYVLGLKREHDNIVKR